VQIGEELVGNAILLKIAGRIDSTTSDEFNASLQPHLLKCMPGKNIVVLDLSSVDYISSAAFRVLLAAQRKAKSQQGAFAVAALAPSVKVLFDMANFGSLIRCYNSVRDAFSDLSQSALAAYANR
jgi:anti-anti-sigma factor